MNRLGQQGPSWGFSVESPAPYLMLRAAVASPCSGWGRLVSDFCQRFGICTDVPKRPSHDLLESFAQTTNAGTASPSGSQASTNASAPAAQHLIGCHGLRARRSAETLLGHVQLGIGGAINAVTADTVLESRPARLMSAAALLHAARESPRSRPSSLIHAEAEGIGYTHWLVPVSR